MPRSSPPDFSESTMPTPSSASVVRSTTRTSMPLDCYQASDSELRRSTSWPACSSAAWTLEPNSRSGISAPTRATALLRPQAPELLARRLRPAPHLGDLDAPAAHLAHGHLAGDSGVVEELQRRVHRRHGGGVAEAVGDEHPPVPVVP